MNIRPLRGVTSLARLLPGRADVTAARRQPARDLLAGLTVAVIALPLALGFGVASGLGAAAGLATAIVAGAVAAIFGGSNLQVSGPTGAMTVVLIPIVHEHGSGGVLTVGLLAGILLLVLAVARLGQVMRYIPAPVVEGFTAGIAAVIFLQQVPAALGTDPADTHAVAPAAWDAVTAFVHQPNGTAIGLAAGVAMIMLVGARLRPTVPFSLLAVALATVLATISGWDVATIGTLPTTLPQPSLGFLDVTAIPALTTAAIAVAALAALESLLSAKVADAMTTGEAHNPDRELFGQGLANIAASLFGGVPATGAIARTAVNARCGAASRLAALSHALILAGIMLVAAPLVSHIPLAALAGVLLATALRMVETHALLTLGRASRSDAVVMALTTTATIALDLVVAVVLGLVVAAAFAVGTIARSTRVEQLTLDAPDHHHPDRSHPSQHQQLARHVAVYRIDGPMFFAAAHDLLTRLTAISDVQILILRLDRVSAVDGTGATILRTIIDRLHQRGITVYLCGTRPEHIKALTATGLIDRLTGQGRIFDSAAAAILAAHNELRHTGAPGATRRIPTGNPVTPAPEPAA